MLNRLILSLFLLVFTLSIHARGVDISLSNETAYFRYLFDSSQIIAGGADTSVGIFYNEDDAYMATAGILVTGNMIGTHKMLKLSAGAKALLGKIDDDNLNNTDIAALAIGAKLAYVIPAATPMAAYIEGYIAPEITSYSDTDKARELNIGFEIEVAPSTKAYLGYRMLELEFKDYGGQDFELDDHIHVGIAMTF